MHSRRVQLSNTVELDISISIHALTWSATNVTVTQQFLGLLISIHALTGSATTEIYAHNIDATTFQFMHSHGVQPNKSNVTGQTDQNFNSCAQTRA